MPRARFGLPRARRLLRRLDFEAARKSDPKTRDPFFTATARHHDGAARIGITVSRRISTRAVTRNRIKRQIRESFRLHQNMLQGFDIVVVAQPLAAATDNAVLARALRALWQRLVPGCSEL